MENAVRRIDGEFFQKESLAYIDRLRSIGAIRLSNLASVTDGIHQSIPFDDSGDVKILSAQHPKENFINLSTYETVTESFHRANPRTALRGNDIIISTVGTIGNAAVVTPEVLPANADRHIGIIRPKAEINPFYISTFLLSRHGRLQSLREATGNVQLNLFISKLNEILVPRFSGMFESHVARFTEQAYALRESASQVSQRAEENLSASLGLIGWAPPEPLTYGRTLQQVTSANRFDAQHFKPEADALVEHLESASETASLGDLAISIQRGSQPMYCDSGKPVVNSQHVNRGEVQINQTNALALVDSARVLIEENDVVINGTGVGTIGRAAPYLYEQSAIPDNHVTVIKLRTRSIEPTYLAAYLNSVAGQIQVNKWLSGSSGQIELYPRDIARFVVTLPSPAVQQEIRNSYEIAQRSRQRAAEVLERAKRAVDIAIEQSEIAALAYLEKGSV